jgi:NADH-quinone oxidoreductase subunit D
MPASRIPSPIPSVLEPPTEPELAAQLMTLNIGPNHPSTHGVLRLEVALNGEEISGLRSHIGYVHTGIEKNVEQKTWWKAIPYFDRMDYLSFYYGGYVYTTAVERLLQLEVPRRAQYLRVLFMELNRIYSHLVWLGTSALELGAMTPFFYCFRERDKISDIFELAAGYRMHPRYFAIGGLFEDIPPAFEAECRKLLAELPSAFDQYVDLLSSNQIFRDRLIGTGYLSPEDAIALGTTGPNLRGSGVDWDLRKHAPYGAYRELDVESITEEAGDNYARYLCRIGEMYESVRICTQVLDGLPEGPYINGDRKVSLPPREELHTSMEAVIHHFKMVTTGFQVPAGEVYSTVESPRGELGLYLVSDGGTKPWRARWRGPSFTNLQATASMVGGELIADLIATVGSIDAVMGDVDR